MESNPLGEERAPMSPYKDKEQRRESDRRRYLRAHPNAKKHGKPLQPELPRWKRLENRIGRTSQGARAHVIPVEIRRQLILRANWKCEGDHTECSGSLCAHHIDDNPENHELSNLLLICHGYHNTLKSARGHSRGVDERDDP